MNDGISFGDSLSRNCATQKQISIERSLYLSLFCHSPVFHIMSSFQRQGMLSDAAFNDDILTKKALSSISTQKKAGDRLICKSSLRLEITKVFGE
jgi:hypothetical protein